MSAWRHLQQLTCFCESRCVEVLGLRYLHSLFRVPCSVLIFIFSSLVTMFLLVDYVVCCLFGSKRMKQRKVNYKVHNSFKETTFDQVRWYTSFITFCSCISSTNSVLDGIHLMYQDKISMDNLDWRQLSVKQSALEGAAILKTLTTGGNYLSNNLLSRVWGKHSRVSDKT